MSPILNDIAVSLTIVTGIGWIASLTVNNRESINDLVDSVVLRLSYAKFWPVVRFVGSPAIAATLASGLTLAIAAAILFWEEPPILGDDIAAASGIVKSFAAFELFLTLVFGGVIGSLVFDLIFDKELFESQSDGFPWVFVRRSSYSLLGVLSLHAVFTLITWFFFSISIKRDLLHLGVLDDAVVCTLPLAFFYLRILPGAVLVILAYVVATLLGRIAKFLIWIGWPISKYKLGPYVFCLFVMSIAGSLVLLLRD